QEALAESERRDYARKKSLVTTQAATVLQTLYVDRVQGKLQSQAEKEGRKRRKLVSDGLPWLMTGEEFFSSVIKHNAAQEREKAEKEKYQESLEEWRKLKAARDKRVEAQRMRYKDALSQWEQEKQLAKQEGRRPGWSKPLLGQLERLPPKPKLQVLRRDGEPTD
ncbi:hypothetical protein BV20DRAFT_920894, partial [Pilatotrama ljubarskyi]